MAKFTNKIKKMSPFQSGIRSGSAESVQPQNGETEAPTSSVSGTVFWPEDFLPEDFPNVRVLTVGYNTEFERVFGGIPQNNMYTLATRLLSDVADERVSSVGLLP